MSTAFAGPFEDSPKGYVKGDRARIVSGDHAGKFGVIQGELIPGYYHVKIEGTGEDAVLETFELEPLIHPVMVAGGSVRLAPMTTADMAQEITDTISRLAHAVTVPPGQTFETTSLRDNLTDLLVELDDVIIEAVSAGVKVRRQVAALAARGIA